MLHKNLDKPGFVMSYRTKFLIQNILGWILMIAALLIIVGSILFGGVTFVHYALKYW